MTFVSRTAGRALRPRFYLEIQGMPVALAEQPMSHTFFELPVIVPGGIVVGESQLDLEALAESGASLTVKLRDTAARALRGHFAARTRRTTWLTTSISRTAVLAGGVATVHVADNTSLPSSGTFHIGAEAFTYTSKSGSTQLVGVQRSEFGTRAQAHAGGTDDGAGVFTVITNWIGRRVTLKGIYVDDEGDTLDDGDAGTIGTFRLEVPPQYLGGDEWELRCGGLHEYFARARCYVGQREAKAPASTDPFLLDGDGVLALTERDAALFATGVFTTQVLLTYEDGVQSTLTDLLDADTEEITVHLGSPYLRDPDLSRPNTSHLRVGSAKHVALLTGDPTRVTLMLLLSMKGDGINHASYDALPGIVRTGFGDPLWRFGAGLHADDVDVEAFEELIGQGPTWMLLLDEEMSVEEILREFCRATHAFWRIDSSGRLTVARLRERTTTPASSNTLTALDDDDLLDDDQEQAETSVGPIITNAKVSANWDPMTEQFLTTVDVEDQDLVELYPEATGGVALESKFLSVNEDAFRANATLAGTLRRANPLSIEALGISLRRMIVATTRTRVFMRHRFGWQALAVEVGDIVRVTNARVPDMRGATVGSIAGAGDCLVVGKQPDLDAGVVALRLLLLERGWVVAPCGIVTLWNAGTKTITLNNFDDTGASPGDSFAAGWDVDLIDVSGGAVATLTIDSVTATTITFTSSPGFTPGTGDVVMPVAAAGLDAATSGYAPASFIYQVPLSGDLGVDDVEATRWS